ncbi:PREDICTED: uncharacterized protein LOC106749266 isoform X2 [Dinoponera quadriceps]|uniref:Uncharacterized protein LOC106749266 isoform X2 n=1 Tax=Dinoponera quadriceps TaxID=609295 RepID=A0A6P3Y165_DINQU|nr:PREDICTED: uncharacterized protein LOC106749266 isoform X2 [Dinoponera quadriceps]
MIPRGNVRSSVFLPEISLQDRRDDCLREKTRIVARRRLGNHTESNSPREVDECQFR